MFFGMMEIVREVLLLFGYVSNGKTFPKPLNKEDEKKYIVLMNKGSEEAKNKLIEHNLRLVAHIAKKYIGTTNVDSDDLISIGTIGLIKGIGSFDIEKKTSLSGYTSRCIENEILMFLRSNKKKKNELYLEDAVAKDKEGNAIKLLDVVGKSEDFVEKKMEMEMYIQILNNVVDSRLTNREKQVLKMRFGLNNSKPLTQNKIATLLNISRSYVSRIEKKALEKLRNALKDFK